MKYLLTVLLSIHGLIHLIGFTRTWNYNAGPPSQEDLNISVQVLALLWVLSCIGFLSASFSFFIQQSWWWMPALCSVLMSQVLVILYWKEARWGTAINFGVLLCTIVSFGQWQFHRTVEREARALLSSTPQKNFVITSNMTSSLPAPVQKWLQHSGIIGRQNINMVRLQQNGWMRTKPQQGTWLKTKAEQYFITSEPGFIWTVHMNLAPLVPVSGRDRLVSGKANMTIKAFSLVNMVNQSGEQIDASSLQRYLAEICWFPSTALSPFIRWEAIDDSSAKATIEVNGKKEAVMFHFNEQGDPVRFCADRYMGDGKNASLQKWEVRSTEFGVRNGIRIPLRCEVTWKLKEGDFTWYKLEISSIEYNLPSIY